jgi:tetraacyldisaccharide 4'-kinase
VRAPRFWTKAKPTLLARALQPIGWAYGQAAARRMANFVAGGAGKTPAAIALARLLMANGKHVAFLSRGYGGAERSEPLLVDASEHAAAVVGDEPLLLAKVASCWVGADRVRSAQRAVDAGANALVLDDGLQNHELAKDLAFAVVDGETGFGNGLCIPAGPLRAPIAAQLPHVRALIVVGGEEAGAGAIAAAAPGKPIIRASLEPDALAAAPLIGREVVAFAGIARPEKFYATLGAILATTEKDRVRLDARQARSIVTLPVTLRFDEPKVVQRMLRAVAN